MLLPSISNDFYATAATRVQETLAAEGYRVFLCVTRDDPAVEAAHLRVLREERAAGLVAVRGPQPPQGNNRRHAPHPAAPLVELVRQSAAQTADAVLIDDVDAGRQGTEHLIGLGHRRIVVLTGPPELSTSRQRLAGYRRALDAAGLAADDNLICSGPYHREAARAATLHLLRQGERPTALLATSNELVVGAVQALRQDGVRVPDEISLIGFGDPDWFALLTPELTTVALPIDEMAVVAAHLLLQRIRAVGPTGAADARPVISRYQAHLIVRGSTRALGG